MQALSIQTLEAGLLGRCQSRGHKYGRS